MYVYCSWEVGTGLRGMEGVLWVGTRADVGPDPVVSAGLGLAWCASRVAYTIGYCRADKEQGRGRQIGSASSFLEIALIAMSGMTGYQMVMA